MKQQSRILRGRRGITMTEVVVAMAVVVIVTAAALSVLTASVRFEVKYEQGTTALSYCESVVDCVRFADNQEMLEEALKKLVIPGITDEEEIEEHTGRIEGIKYGYPYQLPLGGKAISVSIEADAEYEYENYVVTYIGETIYTKKVAYEEET